jgi:Uma2 family endonuclease
MMPVSVSEYLSTCYRPDREYLEGLVLERNLGEFDHGSLQAALAAFFFALRSQGVYVSTEQRVQVKQTRFRIPDVCVVAGSKPAEQIFTTPPFLCIEILSKDDRMGEMRERIRDYSDFGAPNIWIFDPRQKRAWACDGSGMREPVDGILRAIDTEIALPLADLFDA